MASVKMYDKAGSVLRVETTVGNTTDFKVFRPPHDDPNGALDWRPLRNVGTRRCDCRCPVCRGIVVYQDNNLCVARSGTLHAYAGPPMAAALSTANIDVLASWSSDPGNLEEFVMSQTDFALGSLLMIAVGVGPVACGTPTHNSPADTESGNDESSGFLLKPIRRGPQESSGLGVQSGDDCQDRPCLLEELPECLANWPMEPTSDLSHRTVSAECIQKVFRRLDHVSLPLDTTTIEGAIQFGYPDDGLSNTCDIGGVFVARDWALSAMHVVESVYPPIMRERFTEFQYHSDDRDEPLAPVCYGESLFVGGHPLLSTCGFFDIDRCVDGVPVAEIFDIALFKRPRPEAREWFPVSSEIEVGEEVYELGYPNIGSLCDPEQDNASATCESVIRELSGIAVSRGRVTHVVGNGLVTSTASWRGFSGGPVINTRGEIVGITSTLINHMTDPQLGDVEDWYSVAVRLNQKMVDLIRRHQ